MPVRSVCATERRAGILVRRHDAGTGRHYLVDGVPVVAGPVLVTSRSRSSRYWTLSRRIAARAPPPARRGLPPLP
ncbi:hypothetical protein SL103_20505 [Streptomyces lydicus]|uniref:Uncharacterized protein n=2 Tax=Streptomyces lydicus TaxID=47763 RepID=A0A1D7VNF5_9ACTN|nr:hypothetical protein SL103_20505 [Streptomyces lydicus]